MVHFFILKGSISPTFWRKAQMCQEAFFSASRHSSVSPTKLQPTSLLRPTRKYAQLLLYTAYAMCKNDWRKSTDARAERKMLVKFKLCIFHTKSVVKKR
jgi:hypothetical protein